MKRRLQGSMIGMVVLGLALLSPATATWAKKASSGRVAKMKLDLTVHKMKADKIGTVGTNDKVKITVWVKATTTSPTKICSGNFKVLVSKDVGGSWRDLASGGVDNLCAGGVKAGVIRKLYFTDYVPSDLGGAQKYRAEVDVSHWVDEMNETNNIGGTRYIP